MRTNLTDGIYVLKLKDLADTVEATLGGPGDALHIPLCQSAGLIANSRDILGRKFPLFGSARTLGSVPSEGRTEPNASKLLKTNLLNPAGGLANGKAVATSVHPYLWRSLAVVNREGVWFVMVNSRLQM